MDEDDGCRWFLRCTNDASLYISHPTMGKVPVCARCFEIHIKNGGEPHDAELVREGRAVDPYGDATPG